MEDKRKYWLDEPGNVRKIRWALYVICALLVSMDLFYHEHAHYAVEKWFGFHGFYGFVACVLLVLAAKGLRVILARREDYYD